jgi:soluble lytic murein transglycosylase-like protein
MLAIGLSIASGAEASSNKSPPARHRPSTSSKPVHLPGAAAGKIPLSMFSQESAMNGRKLIDRWNPLIDEASRRLRIPSDWIRAVMMEESGGRTMMAENAPIASSMGAMGLMQVMPETWSEMQHIYNLGNDPYSPRDNILAGAAYLRSQYWEYGYPGMFAAYNDGPGMIEAHRRLKQLLPPETAAYVLDIASILRTGSRNAARSGLNFAGPYVPRSSMEITPEGDSLSPPPSLSYAEDDDDDYYHEK